MTISKSPTPLASSRTVGFPPRREKLGHLYISLVGIVSFLTILSGGGAVILALNTPDPMPEAARMVLDMADIGWKTGFATLSGLIAGKAL